MKNKKRCEKPIRVNYIKIPIKGYKSRKLKLC